MRPSGQERSRAVIAAPDDSLGEAAPFNGLGYAQPFESAGVETEIGGERQYDFKNIGQFLGNVRIVRRDNLVGFLDELGAKKFPVLARVSHSDDGLIALSADDLRDPVPDQLFLGRHSYSSSALPAGRLMSGIAFQRPGHPCLASLPEFRGAVEYGCQCLAEYWGIACFLVAAWWLVSAGVWLWLSAE